ncbi:MULTISPECIES: trypsin-like peptidase domain-containing protein [unclassified Roseovarius]|uniref:trypsin-like peptidase domain-containing protein n=1 Tax=unclassified Roseovarius TaxID=2614913 RepID=UPI002740093D|nr:MULTISPECIES: trypsin-like peptidase domain-containing protein [unclassified Roseovarius]
MTRIFIAVVFAMSLAVPAAFSQGQNLAWVQIEAQPSLARAQESIRRYATELQDVNGFTIRGGWYAIALGPYTREDAERVLQVYRAERAIPRDSYIAVSADYRQQFWPVGVNVLDRPALTEPTPAPEATPDTETARVEPEETALPETTPVIEPEPADETLREARANERLLSREERAQLQVALKWAGFYEGRIDASFGRGTRASMSRWQEANSFETTGVLTTKQRAELFRQYNAVLEGLDLKVVRDENMGIEMKLPSGVVEFAKYEPPFAHFNPVGDVDAKILLISQEGDANTLQGLYDIMQTLEIVPETGPRMIDENGFTLIGEGALNISFTQAQLEDGQIKGFTLLWPAGDEERRTRLLSEMQASFRRIDGVLDPTTGSVEDQSVDLVAGLEIRKPRISRSGFYVDTKGTVVTTADVVQSCGRITIDQEYEAQVTLNNDRLGIAVLRPKESLAPISIARFQSNIPRLQSVVAVAGYSYGGLLGAPTLTFGKLADLRGLNGEESVKRLALAPLDGDAGGPVIDAGGAVLGMLLPEPESGRQLPDGVSFAANAGAVQEVLAEAGVSAEDTAGITQIAPEVLTRKAADMTVLVSCWE